VSEREIERLQAVSVAPDDVIVLTLAGIASERTIEKLREGITERFPDNRVMILQGGLTLSVMKPEAVKRATEGGVPDSEQDES